MSQELTLKEIQTISLEILTDVHRFCESHQIHYSLAYGSLLGAIRHKGFIPWDDDIDIFMMRRDYVRFCDEFTSDKYVLVTPNSHKKNIITFARVCENKQTHAPVNWTTEPVGCWIDIFPLDNVQSEDSYKALWDKCNKLWRPLQKMRRCNANISRALSVKTNLHNILIKAYCFGGIIPKVIVRKIGQLASSQYSVNNKYIAQLVLPDTLQPHCDQISDYNEYILVPFEDREFYIMQGWDNVLRNAYGDYYELPPVDQRIAHTSYHYIFWK